MPQQTNWPQLLLQLRQRKGFDRQQLANALGVTEQTLAQYEDGAVELPQTAKFKVRMLSRAATEPQKAIEVPRDPGIEPAARTKKRAQKTHAAQPTVEASTPTYLEATTQKVVQRLHQLLALVESNTKDFEISFVIRTFDIPEHWFQEDYVNAHMTRAAGPGQFWVIRDLERSGSSLVAPNYKPWPEPVCDPNKYTNQYARKLAVIMNSLYCFSAKDTTRLSWLLVNTEMALGNLGQSVAR